MQSFGMVIDMSLSGCSFIYVIFVGERCVYFAPEEVVVGSLDKFIFVFEFKQKLITVIDNKLDHEFTETHKLEFQSLDFKHFYYLFIWKPTSNTLVLLGKRNSASNQIC